MTYTYLKTSGLEAYNFVGEICITFDKNGKCDGFGFFEVPDIIIEKMAKSMNVEASHNKGDEKSGPFKNTDGYPEDIHIEMYGISDPLARANANFK